MEDYELGRLAEELIEKRYGDKLKADRERTDKLAEDVDKLKDGRTYIKVIRRIPSYTTIHIEDLQDKYVFIDIDDITKDLKESKERIVELESKLDNVSRDKNNDIEELEYRIDKFNGLSFFEKIRFVFNFKPI